MTTQELHDLFDQLQDKYGSPYFTDDEKDLFLNRAQQEVIEEYLPDKTDREINLDRSSIILENLDTLIYEVTSTTSASGELTYSTVQTALNSESGNTEPWLVVLNSTYNNKSCKWVRHNDWYKFQENDFKSATSDKPHYKIMSGKFVFLPAAAEDITLTLLKRPIDLELGVTDSELPDRLHNRIVAIGIEFAGLATREEALYSIEQIAK